MGEQVMFAGRRGCLALALTLGAGTIDADLVEILDAGLSDRCDVLE